MGAEQTFIIVKPEAVARGIAGEIIHRFERRGLRIARLQMVRIDRELAKRHYAHLADKPFFAGVLDAITAGPAIIGVLEGPEAISVVRALVGPTDPAKAPAGTIRGDYGTELPFNQIHASDSPESAVREIQLFFGS